MTAGKIARCGYMNKVCPCVMLVFAMILTLNAQERAGGAAGTVVDERGKPVASATVFLAGVIGREAPYAITDGEGKFLLKGLPGRWKLLAYKEADDYPRNFFVFFSSPGEDFPVIDIVQEKTVQNVVVRLGQKAGHLKLRVADDSGKSVTASVTFNRPDLTSSRPDVKGYGDYSTSVTDAVAVPAVPLRVTVEADGYEPWHYGGSDWQTKKGLIRIKSGKTIVLGVRLRRTTLSN